MPQVDHLVNAASEEIGGIAHRTTPRKLQRTGMKLEEMLSEQRLNVGLDQ
jgi:hypothetical protein